MSRTHAKLSWNKAEQHWQIQVLAKNGVYVQKKYENQGRLISETDEPNTIALESGDHLRLGPACLDFLLPIPLQGAAGKENSLGPASPHGKRAASPAAGKGAVKNKYLMYLVGAFDAAPRAEAEAGLTKAQIVDVLVKQEPALGMDKARTNLVNGINKYVKQCCDRVPGKDAEMKKDIRYTLPHDYASRVKSGSPKGSTTRKLGEAAGPDTTGNEPPSKAARVASVEEASPGQVPSGSLLT